LSRGARADEKAGKRQRAHRAGTIAFVSRSTRLADLVRPRTEAFERFAAWERAHPVRLSPAVAVAAVGELYSWLPEAARRRAIDPSGVARLHAALRRLAR